MPSSAECVVIGSGLAGTVIALYLARCGVKVLVLEEKSHPRFAIGESTVPTTTLDFDHLVRTYDVPELRLASHYLETKQVGIASWPKQSFWFGHHRPGKEMVRGEQLLLDSPGLPTGPDCHLLRADLDGYLAS